MMNPSEWDVAKTRQQDLMREAEAHNRAQEMRRNRSKPSRFANIMTGLGEKMVAIGENLQERYGEAHHAEI